MAFSDGWSAALVYIPSFILSCVSGYQVLGLSLGTRLEVPEANLLLLWPLRDREEGLY